MNKSRLVEMLRWVCVLPVAFFAGTFVNYALKFLVMFGLIRWSSLRESELVYWLLYGLVLIPKNAAFVLAGMLTAPRARPITAAVLAGLASLMALVVHVINRRGAGFTNYRDFAIESVGAAVVAACVAIASFRKQAKKTKPAAELCPNVEQGGN